MENGAYYHFSAFYLAGGGDVANSWEGVPTLTDFRYGNSSELGVKVGKINNFSFYSRTCLGLLDVALYVFF